MLGPGLAAHRALRRRRAHSRLMIILSCYSDDSRGGSGDTPHSHSYVLSPVIRCQPPPGWSISPKALSCRRGFSPSRWLS